MIKLKEGTTNYVIMFGISEERNKELIKEWSKVLNEYRRTYKQAWAMQRAGKEIPDEINLPTSFVLRGFIAATRNENEQSYAIFQAGRKIEEHERDPRQYLEPTIDDLLESIGDDLH